MENASKALLMAASILVGLIILSLGIYLVNTFKSFSRNYNDSLELQKIEQFDAEFTSLAIRKNVSIHEIMTLTNYAKEFNTLNNIKKGQDQYISVIIKFNNKGKEFDLTDEADCESKSGYKDYNMFIGDLLDGSYVYKLYVNSVEKEGQYQYDYIKIADNKYKKKYYNCYTCTYYEDNPQTGRTEKIVFEFQKEYEEER